MPTLQLRRLPPAWLDFAVAAATMALDIAAVNNGDLPALPGPVMVAYLAWGNAPLLWRRRAPEAVFGLLLVHQVITVAWLPGTSTLLAPLVALYTVALLRSRMISLSALMIQYAIFLVSAWVKELPLDGAGSTPIGVQFAIVALIYGVVTLLAWTIGRWAQDSRATIDSLEQRRARAAAEAEANERERLAIELHDILAHSMSVIVLQAAGGQKVMAADPARAENAFALIEAVGKASMDELRRLLRVIPAGDQGTPGQDPRPGLAQLPALLESLRRGGLAVERRDTGTPGPLDASVDLSAYRIAQEGLTNSLKHGGPDVHVVVGLDWSPQELNLEVRDDGEGSTDAALSTGHGLVGIRARVRAIGGEVEAGPVPGGGFCLRATLPVAPAPPR